MTIFDRLAASGLSMLTRFGTPQGVALVQAGASVYDPTAGKNTTTSTTYIGTGALLDFSLTEPAVTTVRGTTVEQGDKILYMAVQGTLNGAVVQIPQIGTADSIIVAGATYNVQAATLLNPAGTPVLHVAHIRGVPL